ncbi:MAG: 16S rRNA (guanine(966)-N(2))-methyltransferase RsmD [Clostridia bacterium]|nr:16S rRNA (guanine(966)-N(2))-methyltransferase RsmD [Clostridia bacterium]
MRIIAGKFRGKRLYTLEGDKTRPTSDKVKESVFNILVSSGDIGGRVLDLFAGSGSLGLEALSRGADEAIFVDKNPDAVSVIRKNVALTKANAKVFNTDWKVATRKLDGTQFDMIFIDPPYALKIEAEVITEIEKRGLLADDGILIIEHAVENNFEYNDLLFNADKREYRGTAITFLRKVNEE